MSFEQVGIAESASPAASAEALERNVTARLRPSMKSKERITLQLDIDVVSMFRATGRGWQTRMNAALREWLGPPWAV